MKKTATINEYQFDSFTEMIDFLKQDFGNRLIRWQGCKLLSVFVTTDKDGNKYVDGNADSFKLDEDPNYEDGEFTDLEDYFDEDDQPNDELFAKDYDIDEFRGEEYIPEK